MEFWQQIATFFQHTTVQLVLLVLFATIHGYVGAWLAVRMLFRPRNPIKFLGLTVFPQGMIPRHRERMAKAIGRAVGEELVSQETVLDELFEKDFLRRKIQSVVDNFSHDLLNTSHPTLIEALPKPAREPILDAISALQLKIADHIATVLQNEETATTIHAFVGRRVDEIFSKKISETIDDETFTEVLGFLEKRVKGILNEPVLEQKIIGKRIDDFANTTTPIGEMFTEDAIILLKERLNSQIEPIAHEIALIATSDKTRNQIGALIKREVHEYYDNLAFFKKIFVSRDTLIGEVDDLVNETLPKRIEEMLRGEYFAEEAKSFLNTSIDNLLAKPLPEIIGTISPEKLELLKNQINRNIAKLLQSEEMQQSISNYLNDTLHKLRPHSIGAILQHANSDFQPKLKRMLSNGLLNLLNQKETQNIINSVLSKQIERFMATPIGKLSDHFPEENIKQAGVTVTNTIIIAAKEKLPEAIREFNIGEVVRDKIANYPAEKLENLVMSVAKEHLRTIELFGALFGFVIGLVQAVYTYWALLGK
jgi:uncharacterized membrane protein YheB (UPF0754 family)